MKDKKDKISLLFSTVSTGGMAVMVTNILSNAVFHVIEGNIVNHKICVGYIKDICQRMCICVRMGIS